MEKTKFFFPVSVPQQPSQKCWGTFSLSPLMLGHSMRALCCSPARHPTKCRPQAKRCGTNLKTTLLTVVGSWITAALTLASGNSPLLHTHTLHVGSYTENQIGCFASDWLMFFPLDKKSWVTLKFLLSPTSFKPDWVTIVPPPLNPHERCDKWKELK